MLVPLLKNFLVMWHIVLYRFSNILYVTVWNGDIVLDDWFQIWPPPHKLPHEKFKKCRPQVRQFFRAKREIIKILVIYFNFTRFVPNDTIRRVSKLIRGPFKSYLTLIVWIWKPKCRMAQRLHSPTSVIVPRSSSEICRWYQK